jgi:predicted ATPase
VSNGSHSREHLDKAYRGWDKDTYPKQGNLKALCRVLDYVEAGTNPQRGLGLVGPVGCGKTSLVRPTRRCFPCCKEVTSPKQRE